MLYVSPPRVFAEVAVRNVSRRERNCIRIVLRVGSHKGLRRLVVQQDIMSFISKARGSPNILIVISVRSK